MLLAEDNDLLCRVQRGACDGTDHAASLVPVCLLQEPALCPTSGVSQ
jgi:hypothetical protein